MADIGEIVKKNTPVLKWVGIIFLVLVALHFIRKYMSSQTETLYDADFSQLATEGESDDLFQQPQQEQPQEVQSMLGQDISSNKPNFMGSEIQFPTTGQDILPMDLLPKSAVAGEFSEEEPATDLAARNYLVTSANFGIDTTSSSNKNPNLDIRSQPYIPTNMNVSPWNVSSYTPDLYSREFNIGK
jgi:hypothetical protein